MLKILSTLCLWCSTLYQGISIQFLLTWLSLIYIFNCSPTSMLFADCHIVENGGITIEDLLMRWLMMSIWMILVNTLTWCEIRNSMYKSNMRKIGRLRDDSNMNQEISFVSVRISLSFLVVCVCVYVEFHMKCITEITDHFSLHSLYPYK